MFAFMAGHLHSWSVICVCRWSVSLYIVVGGGRHVVVVVGSVVLWLLWWLMEERKNVTPCDIHVMFKLTHEITWIISCDNYIVCTVNTPSHGPVLVQPRLRWNFKLSPGSPTNFIWPSYLWNAPELCDLVLFSWRKMQKTKKNTVLFKIFYLIPQQWEHLRT